MRVIRVLRQRARSLFRRSQVEQDMHAELALHLQQLELEYRAAGMSDREAHDAALRAFGPVDVTAETCRDTRRVRVVEEAFGDAKFGLRLLARSPAFTLTAVLSLALGIGATTAMYSLTRQVIMTMLPVRDPQAIMSLARTASHQSQPQNSFSVPMFRDLDHAAGLPFEGFFAFDSIHRLTMLTDAGAEPVRGELVSGSYFDVLGVRPAIGRVLTRDDDKNVAGHPVAVLSFNFWKRRFAQDPSVLNTTVRLNGHPFTIVGVSAAGFDGMSPGISPDIRVPLMMEPVIGIAPGVTLVTSRGDFWINIYGRLRTGATPEQAAAALTPFLIQALDGRQPAAAQKMYVVPAPQGTGGWRRTYDRALYVLTAVAGAVLLLACVNIAHLLLARGAKRAAEFRIRLSIGAGRLRLIRQMLTESVLLAVLGAVAAMPVEWALGKLILVLAIDDSAHATLTPVPDGNVLAFSFAVALATAVLFGILPAVRAVKPDLVSRTRSVTSHALIGVQIALSLVLLASAGLFTRSLVALRGVDTGFRPEGLLQAGIDPGPGRRQFYADVLTELRSVPGIQSASLGRQSMIGGSSWSSGIAIEGVPNAGEGADARRDVAASSYFSTLGIPLLLGREFTEADTLESPKVAIVNEAFVNRYFAGQNPIGRRIGPGGRAPEFAIVGVTKNAKYRSLREDTTPFWYIPYTQLEKGREFRAATVFVRSSLAPDAAVETLRLAVSRVDRNVALFDVRTLEAQVGENTRRERLLAVLSILFGTLAALLAGTGLFGVLSWSVAQRRREIGIRMAIGARPAQAAWAVFRGVVGFIAAGVAAGLFAAAALGQTVQSLLYEVKPDDPLALASAALMTAVVATFATLLPARAAASVQPASTLRSE